MPLYSSHHRIFLLLGIKWKLNIVSRCLVGSNAFISKLNIYDTWYMKKCFVGKVFFDVVRTNWEMDAVCGRT